MCNKEITKQHMYVMHKHNVYVLQAGGLVEDSPGLIICFSLSFV